MAEPISWKKAFDPRPTALIKSTSATGKGLLVLGMFAVFGYSLWVALIQPHTKWAQKAQTQSITIEKGATATIIQKTDTPKKWLFLFIEPFVEQRQHASMQTGIRVGTRIEW